jgi:hypothetical protein
MMRLKQIQLTAISDELRRTKVWGDQAKATRLVEARGFLDNTLRTDKQFKSFA